MERHLPPLVIMGVSGCGKSTIGMLLGTRLGVPFADGDDYHSPANKMKMGQGTPLTDDDRWPWLAEIGHALANTTEERTGVIACSALKRRYRDFLRTYAPDLVFIHLTGGTTTIIERINGRIHEYMPSTLLESQLATLEAPDDDEAHITIDINASPDNIVAQIVAQLEGKQLIH